MRLADSPLFTEYMERATAAAVSTAVKSGQQDTNSSL
jgi:hypothetical protein